MTHIIIGSKSDRKIDIVRKVAEQYLGTEITITGFASKSGVPETPWDTETFIGPQNRALDAQKHQIDATYWIGLESGLVERYGHVYEEAWTVIRTQGGAEYYGYSSGLKVPDYILNKMDSLKKPHSEIMALIEEEFGKMPNDTWGTYSGGILLRTISLEESLRNALIQIIGGEKSFYKK